MTKRPISRAESQASTRDTLIKTATRLITEESIPGLSLRRLCAEAGFTQGAFYANFADKDALLVEVMKRHLGEQQKRLAALTATLTASSLQESFGAFSAWLGGLDGQRGWAALALEIRLHAHRDPQFGKTVAAAEQPLMANLSELVEVWASRHGLRPILTGITLAETLLGIWYSTVLRKPAEGAAEMVFVPVFQRLLVARD